MKKSSLILIFLFTAALLLVVWKVYDGIYFKKGKQTTIKCHYMAYACGDCYPQWQVDSSFAVEKGFKELIGRDIYVEREGIALEQLITDTVSKCIICYDFYFNGSLRKTLSNKYSFEAESFQMELRFKDCCN